MHMTPLMIAVSSDHKRIVQYVIQGGVHVNHWIEHYGTAIDVIISITLQFLTISDSYINCSTIMFDPIIDMSNTLYYILNNFFVTKQYSNHLGSHTHLLVQSFFVIVQYITSYPAWTINQSNSTYYDSETCPFCLAKIFYFFNTYIRRYYGKPDYGIVLNGCCKTSNSSKLD